MPQTKYTPLDDLAREEIADGLRNGLSYRAIGEIINHDHTVVMREVKRNSQSSCNTTSRVNKPKTLSLDSRHYRGTAMVDLIRQRKQAYQQRVHDFAHKQAKYEVNQATMYAKERKSNAMKQAHPLILLRPEYAGLRQIIEARLRDHWSPEQISVRLSLINALLMIMGYPSLVQYVSHKAIYHYIQILDNKNLVRYLRYKGKPYSYQKRQEYNQTNKSKHSIHDRPPVINNLTRSGDLEGDTIVSSDTKDRLLTHEDRLTGVGSISRILGFNGDKVKDQTKQDIARIYDNQVHSITYDNGIEFVKWLSTQKELQGQTDSAFTIYFADPYHSCQRGRNENFNRIVREFYPKGTDFKKITKSDILKTEALINNRPRKRFEGLTPLEVWQLVHLMG